MNVMTVFFALAGLVFLCLAFKDVQHMAIWLPVAGAFALALVMTTKSRR
jgi:hypothetical protein